MAKSLYNLLMSLNSTPTSERIQIGFFGRTNVGKSSVVNAVTNQNLALVSDVSGTTTDPVSKAMELLPIGPVSIIDTAGLDDKTELGQLRIEKTKQVINRIDIAVLVVDVNVGITPIEEELITIFKNKNIKYVVAYNKADLLDELPQQKDNHIYISATRNINIYELKELIASVYSKEEEKFLLKDVVYAGDYIIMVTPIDASAPKGRIILPQQQVLRELLEIGAITTVVKETELEQTLKIKKPKLIITDSQVFNKVSAIISSDILLTSFSILFARYKGVLKSAVKGVNAINKLEDGDVILISEGCTHHRQCEDIGTVKIPNWLKKYTNKNLNFEFTSGGSFPNDLSKYKMVIHCGGCTLKDKEVIHRYNNAQMQYIPISNYGITIAFLNGILKRSVQIFPDIYAEIE